MKRRKYRAVFLDRDGVINKKALEEDYIKNWDEFEFLPGVKEAIKKLNEEELLVIIVSNQRGIAKGLMTEDDLNNIHAKMKEELREAGAKIDGIYYCPHDVADHCDCRKPKPGLLLKAAEEWSIDLNQSWMIGDKESDVEAGKKAGCKTILVEDTSQSSCSVEALKPDLVAKSLSEAVDKLLKLQKRGKSSCSYRGYDGWASSGGHPGGRDTSAY